jgi:hypothetical protein
MGHKFIVCFVVLLAAVTAFAEDSVPIVREEQKVTAADGEESWRLEWASAPRPACSPDQPEWMTCPCIGFAFGERGNLTLVRRKSGHNDERFALTKLFDGDLDGPGYPGEAVLRRWDVGEKDIEQSDSATFASGVYARPIATVMRFGDYDHDGRATEFLLQVGTLPCGKQMSVAVGISPRSDRVHVFGTAEHPEKPLVLQAPHWESLLQAKGPVKVVDWVCGDHGSDTETELELRADAEGIHATRTEYKCKADASRGELISTEPL